MPTIDDQIAFEREMLDTGGRRFRAAVERAQEAGREDTTPYADTLLGRSVVPVAAALRAWIETATSGRACRRGIAVKYLRDADPVTTAYIALRVMLATAGRKVPLQNLAMAISERIEDEARYSFFRGEDRTAYRYARGRADHATTYRHRTRVMTFAMNRASVAWEPWPKTDRLHVGVKAVELVIEATGYWRIYNAKTGRHVRTYVAPTERVVGWIARQVDTCALMLPDYLPTIIPPKPWESEIGGGYYALPDLPLVLSADRATRTMPRPREQMPAIYASLNALQATPWTVNRRVLDVALAVWKAGGGRAGIPIAEAEPVPPRPADIDTDDEARKAWKASARAVHERNNKLAGRCFHTVHTLEVAKRMTAFARFWFPYQLDSRGRAYAVARWMSPQGHDLGRGMLLFAAGDPIEDEVAAGWLAIHGANTYGEDKRSLVDRIGWVVEHEDQILAVDADPLGTIGWWGEADKPWQFLAWCLEWAAFQRHGYGYVSALPLGQDGSCSGIQHFSAMLRDERGGAAVNLVPGEVPRDVYGDVAEVVADQVRLDASKSGDDADYARRVLLAGIDRALVKRPVMVLPYGGTRRSCQTYLIDQIAERVAEARRRIASGTGTEDDGRLSAAFTDDDTVWDTARYLTPVVWEAIGQVVTGARTCMAWIRKCASIVVGQGRMLEWMTPLGFVVRQTYAEQKRTRVETHIMGKRKVLALSDGTEAPELHRQVNASAPNFVHALDACHLHMTVTAAADRGVTALAMIHDDFGTTAAQSQALADTLRRTFVDLYEGCDVLEEFRRELQTVSTTPLPEPPPRGRLDITAVLDSDYFFA